MLRKAKTMTGYKLECSDGVLGSIKDFLFDDTFWTIRYLVIDTGGWLHDRQVLISPHALVAVNELERHITVNLTKKQIEGSPPLSTNRPVSRQFEKRYYDFYGWPHYWGGPFMWGPYPYAMGNPSALPMGYATGNDEVNEDEDEEAATTDHDPHLRSSDVVRGYHVQATDGHIGHVENFLIDDKTWSIRYLVIDTQDWWPGKRILISPEWIDGVSWGDSEIFVNVTKDAIKTSPEYTEDMPLIRPYEETLHKNYDRDAYWLNEDKNVVNVL